MKKIKELQEELEHIDSLIPHWRFLFELARTQPKKHERSLVLLELFDRRKEVAMEIAELQLAEHKAKLLVVQADIELARAIKIA